MRRKGRWKIYVYIALLEWDNQEQSLKTKETKLQSWRTRELGSHPFPVWGQADVLGRHEHEEVWDLWCRHSYKASCTLLSATLLFFRTRAVKNCCTSYAFLSSPATASRITFPVSAATLISPCKSLERLCFFHSPLRAFCPGFPTHLALRSAHRMVSSSNCVQSLFLLNFSFGLKALCGEGGPAPASGRARHQQVTGLRESETQLCISSQLSVSSAQLENPWGCGLAWMRAEVGYSLQWKVFQEALTCRNQSISAEMSAFLQSLRWECGLG